MAKFVKKCPCLRPPTKEVHELDYRHSNLYDVPGEVFMYERTLEELYLDTNQIQDLPRELFYCHGLRKMCVSDNEIRVIPSAIGSLIYLQHLDISKNGIVDLPDNVKCCKNLTYIDVSVNPLGKIPDGFTNLVNLTELFLNDTFLDYLPGNFGRLSKLKTLELRENHLKTLPNSVNRLKQLEKLDIGHNQFTELPDVCGQLTSLLELWCDHNSITYVHSSVGNLKQLMFFDASKNKIEELPEELSNCTCLADLHLSQNQLEFLPANLGNMENLTTLKVEDNNLMCLPNTMGGLKALSELDATSNDLTTIPPSLGRLRNLRTLYLDDNLIESLPAELGSCSGITVLSVRANKLTYLPDEIGRIPQLRVLNLSNNLLDNLPFSFIKLKQLQALWLSENQTKPLIPFQTETDSETGMKVLTCYLLPQGAFTPNDGESDDDDDVGSFHESVWEEERQQRQTIHFKFDEEHEKMQLSRHPTPYPKELKEQARHARNEALRRSMASGPTPEKEQVDVSKVSQHDTSKVNKPLSPNLQNARKLLQNNTFSDRRITRRSPERDLDPSVESHPAALPRDPSPVQSVLSMHSARSVDSVSSEPVLPHPQSTKCNVDLERRDSSSSHCQSRHHRPQSATASRQTVTQTRPRVEGRHARPQSATLSHSTLPQPVTATSHKLLPRSISENASFTNCRNQTNSPNMSSSSSDFTQQRLIHCQPQSQPVIGRRRAYSNRNYESDTGYIGDSRRFRGNGFHNDSKTRSNSCRSDTEYRSNSIHDDIEHRSSFHGDTNRDTGYQSDQGVCRPRRMLPDPQVTQKSNEKPHSWTKDGYASDLEAYSARMFNRMHQSSSLSSNLRDNTERVRSSLLEISRLSLQQLNKSASLRANSSIHESRYALQTAGDTLDTSGDRSVTSDNARDADRQSLIDQRLGVSSQDTNNSCTGSNKSDSCGLELPIRTPPPYTPAPAYHQNGSPNHGAATPNKTTTPQTLRAYLIDPSLHTANSNHRLAHQYSLHNNETFKPSPSHTQLSPNTEPGHHLRHDHSQTSFHHLPYVGGNTTSSHNASFNQSDISQNSPHLSSIQSPQDSCPQSPSHHPTSPMLHIEDPHTSGRDVLSYQLALHDGSMSKYDDTDEPISQVSSSTDSGFVHGTNAFDHLGLNTTDSSSSTPRQSIPSPGLVARDPSHSQRSTREMNVPHASTHSTHLVLQDTSCIFQVELRKNPGLGFSIAGGLGSYGNPFHADDEGIYITKVQADSAAASQICRGDKILEVNGVDFRHIEHTQAVSVMKACDAVSLILQR